MRARRPATASATSRKLDVEASPPLAGAGIVYDFQQSYWNTFGLAALRSPIAVEIDFPLDTVLNGPLFPQCDPDKLRTQGRSACPPGSEFATGQAVTAVVAQGVTITASLTDFVGPSLDGHPTLLLYVVPQLGSPFVLTGVISTEPGGPQGLTLQIDLTALPGATPLTPSPIVIVSLHNQDMHTTVTRQLNGRQVRTPLIVAPPTCTGSWPYEFTSIYLTGPPLTSTTEQPCVAQPPSRSVPQRRHRHPRHNERS